MEYWQIILIIVFAIIAGLIIGTGVHYYLYKKYHYICPRCSKRFKPANFFLSMFSMNGGKKRKVRCIYCNTKDWALMVKDK